MKTYPPETPEQRERRRAIQAQRQADIEARFDAEQRQQELTRFRRERWSRRQAVESWMLEHRSREEIFDLATCEWPHLYGEAQERELDALIEDIRKTWERLKEESPRDAQARMKIMTLRDISGAREDRCWPAVASLGRNYANLAGMNTAPVQVGMIGVLRAYPKAAEIAAAVDAMFEAESGPKATAHRVDAHGGHGSLKLGLDGDVESDANTVDDSAGTVQDMSRSAPGGVQDLSRTEHGTVEED